MRSVTVAIVEVVFAASAFGQNVLVSVPGDYPTVVAAVNAANADTDAPLWTITVGPGIWTGGFEVQRSTHLESSDGPSATTLSGNVLISFTHGEAELRGFNLPEPQVQFSTPDSAVTVADCVFADDIRSSALLLGGSDCTVTVERCTFNNNTQEGAIRLQGRVSLFVRDSVFTDNAMGPYAEKNGGAIYAGANDSSVVAIRCVFDGNSAAQFGGAILARDLTVANSLFVNNEALWGGALFLENGPSSEPHFPEIVNCTFADNDAFIGGAIVLGHPFILATLWNTILYQNGTTPIATDALSAVLLNYTLMDEGPNPFVDQANGDYHLRSESIAIDAGHNWAIVALADTDLDGNPRFGDAPGTADTGCGIPVIVDMGAYEYQGDPVAVTLGDVDGDGGVGTSDLLALLAAWGPTGSGCSLADLDLDGTVGTNDLLMLLAEWE